ncbi:hypothetical protein VSQ32_03200 [Lachnospiraceae bacterium KK002]
MAAKDLKSVHDKNGKATSKKEVLISAGKIKKGQFMKVQNQNGRKWQLRQRQSMC